MIKRIVVTLFLSLSVSGCGLSVAQRQTTSQIANATSGLGEFSATELLAFRHATIEMNIKDIAIGGKTQMTKLEGAFEVPEVMARVNAAMALSSYGNLLLALVDENQQSNINANATEFITHLQGVSGQKSNTDQLDGVGAVVNNIGGLFIEQQKAKAIKKIVSNSKVDIDHICDLFIKDLSRTELNLLQGVDTTAKQLMADADTALSSTQNVQDRILATEAFALAYEQKNKAKIMGEKGIAALQALKLANAELEIALNNDMQSLPNARALGMKMNELGLALKVLSSQ